MSLEEQIEIISRVLTKKDKERIIERRLTGIFSFNKKEKSNEVKI